MALGFGKQAAPREDTAKVEMRAADIGGAYAPCIPPRPVEAMRYDTYRSSGGSDDHMFDDVIAFGFGHMLGLF